MLVVLEEVMMKRRSYPGTGQFVGRDGAGVLPRARFIKVVVLLLAASSRSTDVFVIGGGPAGLAAAIAARLKGFDVIVADAARPPIDKACGEGLMPDSFAALRRLGVALDGVGLRSFPFLLAFGFTAPACRLGLRFPRDGLTSAIRRTRLHEVLIDRARQAGVAMRWEGTRA